MTPLFGLAPGHPSTVRSDGTPHPGATVANMVEADETLSWCRYFHRHSSHDCEPHHTVMLRSAPDEVVSLNDRGARAQDAGCDFVLSVHINWWHTEHLHGALAFYSLGDRVGRGVADTILRCMPEPLRRETGHAIAANPDDPQDEWLEAPKAVLDPYHRRGIPSALLEVGYMTNPTDNAAMRDPDVQYGVLCAVFAGVARARVLLREQGD